MTTEVVSCKHGSSSAIRVTLPVKALGVSDELSRVGNPAADCSDKALPAHLAPGRVELLAARLAGVEVVGHGTGTPAPPALPPPDSRRPVWHHREKRAMSPFGLSTSTVVHPSLRRFQRTAHSSILDCTGYDTERIRLLS